MSRPSLNTRVGFVLALARRLHQYGTSSPRLEGAVSQASQRLGLEADIWSSPTAIILSFAEADSEDDLAQVTQVMRLPPGDVNLGRLCEVDRIAARVGDGDMDVYEGRRRLQALNAPLSRRRRAAMVASYGLAAASVAVLLRTSWVDALAAGIIGALIGLITVFAFTRPRLALATEAIGALVATLLATMVSAWLVPLALKSVVVASLIVVVPGMALTTAVRELSSQHLVSGVARISGALATLLKLAFGAVAASQICIVFGVVPAAHGLAPVPGWLEPAAVLLAALAIAVLFQAARRDWPLAMAAVVGGYLVTRVGAGAFGAPFGAFAGGLVLGALANLYARVCDRPGALLREPGILLLVPGSISFRGITYLFERNVNLSANTGIVLLSILVALVAGLLFGDLLIPPRRSL